MQNELEHYQRTLEQNKQLILQGPPGTGKTLLAKELAKKLANQNTEITFKQNVEKFIETYERSPDAESLLNKNYKLLEEFREIFPPEELHTLTLDKYCIGSGSKDTFCYWLERQFKDLGRFSPGGQGSPVYGVYFNKKEGKYETNNIGKSPEDAMAKIASAIHNLVNNEEINEAKKYFRDGLILKILQSYYPQSYFPVFNHRHIKNIATSLGIKTSNKDIVSINKEINKEVGYLMDNYKNQITTVEVMWFIYNKFNLGDILLDSKNELEPQKSWKLVQFHPSYNYDDFVRGLVPKKDENGLTFEPKNKVLLEIAEAAKKSSLPHVLIIDEINRANLPAVLGELIYALEYRDKEVDCLYPESFDEDGEGNRKISLPSNLYIIGTMNTADRSVGTLDYAIRRRFAFEHLSPEPVNVLKDGGYQDGFKLYEQVMKIFKQIKSVDSDDSTKWESLPNNHLSAEFDFNDVMIGHSYFMANGLNEGEDLKNNLEYKIKPILREYAKDGVLIDNGNESVMDKINDLPNR